MRTLDIKRLQGQSGFTLIELVIVIVIIGILAAVAIPNFSTITDDANQAKADAVAGALKSQYSILLAKGQGTTPAFADVLAAMADPKCTSAGVCGVAPSTVTCTPGTTLPSTISCSFP